MKTEDIEKLLFRFYQGETDEEEEKFLAQYLSQIDSDERYKADRDVFHSLSEDEPEVPSELEFKISTLIDSWEESEKKQTKRFTKLRFSKQIIGIAASLLLVISIGFWYQHYNSANSEIVNTYNDPDASHEVVIEALRLFSKNFSKGTQALEKADSRVDNTFKILEKVINE